MYKIFIDPGHGGKDRANRGPTGYIEADGVLAISKYLRDELVKTGAFEVKLSREKDVFLEVRARGVMAANWKADLFLSEHTNATGQVKNTTVRGTTVYRSIDLLDGEIASLLSSRVAAALGIPDRGAKTRVLQSDPSEDYYGVIDAAQDGGVDHVLLIETAFHDNALDEALLKNDANLKLVGYVQAGVICSLFKVRNALRLYSGNKWAIDQLQAGLNKLGYKIFVDGIYGSGTEAAVKKFQIDNGLSVTGIVDTITWKKFDEKLNPPTPKPTPTIKGTSIIGKNVATADQLFEFAAAGNSTPKLTVPLLQLCRLYLEEGVAEGIRGDIAFCQACKETGFFSYTGTAKPEWNNFAGLGVTGQKNPDGTPMGCRFADAKTGVRAHIQHLKAYASTEPLKQAQVDPRFAGVKRGRAPVWEYLGRDENPENAKRDPSDRQGWAVPGTTYGHDIVKMYEVLIKIVPNSSTVDPKAIKPTVNTLNSISDWISKLIGKK